jgi:hypothetical protein
MKAETPKEAEPLGPLGERPCEAPGSERLGSESDGSAEIEREALAAGDEETLVRLPAGEDAPRDSAVLDPSEGMGCADAVEPGPYGEGPVGPNELNGGSPPGGVAHRP